jgi:hypothetical protein
MTHRPTRIIILALLIALGAAAIPTSAGAAPSFVDTQVKANILLLRGYIDEYAIKNSFTYPSAAMVKKGGGLVPANGIWPANPWTGRTMVPSKTRGNYTYTTNAARTNYALVGHLSSGAYKLTGSAPAWMKVNPNTEAKVGGALLSEYVDQFASANGGTYPIPSQVTASGQVGLQHGMLIWPVDPWSGKAMIQGASPGQFEYVVNVTSYTLSVHLAGGTTWSVPGH